LGHTQRVQESGIIRTLLERPPNQFNSPDRVALVRRAGDQVPGPLVEILRIMRSKSLSDKPG
jgi:hypothetical protein